MGVQLFTTRFQKTYFQYSSLLFFDIAAIAFIRLSEKLDTFAVEAGARF